MRPLPVRSDRPSSVVSTLSPLRTRMWFVLRSLSSWVRAVYSISSITCSEAGISVRSSSHMLKVARFDVFFPSPK